MDTTPHTDRLSEIEAKVDALTALIEPMAKAWVEFGPRLRQLIDNPIARWKGGRGG